MNESGIPSVNKSSTWKGDFALTRYSFLALAVTAGEWFTDYPLTVQDERKELDAEQINLLSAAYDLGFDLDNLRLSFIYQWEEFANRDRGAK